MTIEQINDPSEAEMKEQTFKGMQLEDAIGALMADAIGNERRTQPIIAAQVCLNQAAMMMTCMCITADEAEEDVLLLWDMLTSNVRVALKDKFNDMKALEAKEREAA